ncbi:hypothetical protein [Nonomuraea sp. NPDC023979]|uniref:hypothetical protein n=1 Tax=Nonomuraea sp. NPDC023979 TaxID=3154796 RepID=UPI0033EE4B30
MNADLAIAVTAAAALLAVNAAYEIRDRRRARERARLHAVKDALTRQVWAAEFEHVRLIVDGQFAALGSDALWAHFLAIHPELQPAQGQRGGTA